MLMKWSDLEPGDIIKWSQEARDRFGREGGLKYLKP